MGNDLRIRNAAGMLVFAEVVEAGSMSAAARRLGLSKSAVSRQVANLERRLGAQLLRRTTRRMSLTELGELFYSRCQRVAEEAEAAERSIGDMQTEPRGEIRVAAPMTFGHARIVPLLPAFLARYPKLRIHLDLTDRIVDLVREKFDLSIRIAASLSDSTLVRRKLCSLRMVLCASPAYLRRHGTPRTRADLRDHNCLGYRSPSNRWVIGRERVETSGNLSIDNGDGLRRAALLGLGIVYLPSFAVGEDLAAGRLVPLLEDASAQVGAAWALYPASRHPAPKVRALIDHLAAALAGDPPWDAWMRAAQRRRSAAAARSRSSRAS